MLVIFIDGFVAVKLLTARFEAFKVEILTDDLEDGIGYVSPNIWCSPAILHLCYITEDPV
jgi:hypothetical protein